ncbi:MAG: transcriptional repressor LexA [Ignavibacteriaceae bacterium]
MKNELTNRQQEILNFIKQFREVNGYPPTLREIGKQFQITSTFGVKRHLDALVKKGFLTIESNASRGISVNKHSVSDTVFDRNDLFQSVPIVGRVAAGSPILAMENIEGSIVIDPTFLKNAESCFALRVQGESMSNAGIFDGDLVIVLPSADANNGDIVVAMLDDEVTVKTFENRNNTIRLIPRNQNFQPIEITPDREFKIIGRVKGVLRWLN